MAAFFDQKVLFLLGKGGVGRSTTAATLGYHCSQNLHENVLIIQWALTDVLSPLFGAPQAGHKHRAVLPNLSIMNYDGDEAVREYFVEHLGMGFFYHFILENRQVQKLIHAAPGFEELFFLGRLFWVVELAEAERGYRFDRILIDAPATGHGAALFGVASTISKFKLTGPLVSESSRVARLLDDSSRVGTILVTLPEELPVEETIEMIPTLECETGRPPLAIVLNRSLRPFLPECDAKPLQEASSLPGPLAHLKGDAEATARVLRKDLLRRFEYEEILRSSTSLRIISLPDVMISDPKLSDLDRIKHLSEYFQ